MWSRYKAKKKKIYVALTRPKLKNWVGRSGFFFFFFFFLRTVRELSVSNFFFKFLNGENSGGMQSKRIYNSCKCFFKPLNTNFSKFFAQIWHLKKKKKKKTWPCFFAFYGRSGEGNITIFFFGLTLVHMLFCEHTICEVQTPCTTKLVNTSIVTKVYSKLHVSQSHE